MTQHIQNKNSRVKIFKVLLPILMVVILLIAIPAFAYLNRVDGPSFFIRLDEEKAAPGTEVHVRLIASPGKTTAGAFRVSLQYDAQTFEYLGKEDAPQTSGADIFVRQDDPMITVYTCDIHQGSAALLSGNIITYVFRVRQTAEPKNYFFRATVDEVCDYDGHSLQSSGQSEAALQVNLQDSSSQASSSQEGSPCLTALEPENSSLGQLVPPFDSEVTSYQMTVPESCREIWFRTEQSAETAVTVNRHTLLPDGNDTVITITAKSLDGKKQKQYWVMVHKLHGETSAAAPDTPVAQEIAVSSPAGATLSPAFSPEIHRYTLTVPDSCSQVWLKVNTANNAAASANRHTLQAAGSDTVITVHVTSADRKSTSDYTVVVHRLAPQEISAPAFSGRKAKSAGIAGAKTAHKTAVSKSYTRSQKKSLNRKTTSAGKKSTSKKSTSKKSINKKSASKQGKDERYTPSAASYAENLHGQQMNVTGTDGFSGFQSGMLVFFLIAAAALAAILGTRAWCRRHSNQTEAEDEPSKSKGQEAKDPQQKQK
jgi:hypothetical protein